MFGQDDESCQTCENACELPRPLGCAHECPLPCHPAPCPPCRVTLRPRCHCGVTQLFIKCAEWTKPGCDQVVLTSCGSPCPKSVSWFVDPSSSQIWGQRPHLERTNEPFFNLQFPCGHKCTSVCHPGDCPDYDKCSKKTKAYCPCRRIKKEVRCDIMRAPEFSLPCDETCEVLKHQKEKVTVYLRMPCIHYEHIFHWLIYFMFSLRLMSPSDCVLKKRKRQGLKLKDSKSGWRVQVVGKIGIGIIMKWQKTISTPLYFIFQLYP